MTVKRYEEVSAVIVPVTDIMTNLYSPYSGKIFYGMSLDDDTLRQLEIFLSDPSLDKSMLFTYDGENGQFNYLSEKLIDIVTFDIHEAELEPEQLLKIIDRKINNCIVFHQYGNELGDFWAAFVPIENE